MVHHLHLRRTILSQQRPSMFLRHSPPKILVRQSSAETPAGRVVIWRRAATASIHLFAVATQRSTAIGRGLCAALILFDVGADVRVRGGNGLERSREVRIWLSPGGEHLEYCAA